MGLNGIAFAMIGLVYGLCHWIFYCSGVRAGQAWWRKKSDQEDDVPDQAIGAMGSLVAGISLFALSFWLLWNPGSNQFVVMALAGLLNGSLFLGTALVAVKGWDWRPVGNLALVISMVQVVVLPFAALWGFPADACLGLLVWSVLAMTWGLAIHGKVTIRTLRVSLVLSLMVAWWFMIFYGNVYQPLSLVTNLDNSLSGETWAYILAIVGILEVVIMSLVYRFGRADDGRQSVT